jgi:glycosyltransferase involved in cell wall biosynthesis
VIYPPVAVDRFFWEPPEDYYLIVSELVPYKRLDYAVRYCAKTGRRLKVAGDGPQFSALKKLAGPTIEFCGKVSDAEIQSLYARSRAFLMPGEEDFGITAVESLASGKPVIALGRGGVLESVTDGITGVLYSEPDECHLAEAVNRFEAMDGSISVPILQAQAAKFSEATFFVAIGALLDRSKASTAHGLEQTLHGR